MFKPLTFMLSVLAVPLAAQDRGRPFHMCIIGLSNDSVAQDANTATIRNFFDEPVLKADRSQSFFQRDSIDFSQCLISSNRIVNGRIQGQRQDTIFDRIEAEFGMAQMLPRDILETSATGMGVSARGRRMTDPPASPMLPMGRKGPAFLAYQNFDADFEWNQSCVYVLTTAYFGTRLEGAPIYNAGNPDAGLSGKQMQALQQRLGLPADELPTLALMELL